MANVAEAPTRYSASLLANFNYEKYGLLVVFIMIMDHILHSPVDGLREQFYRSP